MSRTQNVTMVNDLPDLDELDAEPFNGVNHVPDGSGPEGYVRGHGLGDAEFNKVRKMIRDPHIPPSQSGMTGMGHPTPLHSHQRFESSGGPGRQENFSPWENSPRADSKPIEFFRNSPSCIEIAYHIKDCPICSQFYRSDKAPYMIAIVVLVILCILLLKKVLNV